MKEWGFGAVARVVLAAILAAVTTLLGGWDTVIAVLLALIGLDIASGFIRAFIHKELSSDESFPGMAKKALILCIVAVAVLLEKIAATTFMRNAVIMFYCASEALSILENSVAAGLPVPEFLRAALKQLNKRKFPEP